MTFIAVCGMAVHGSQLVKFNDANRAFDLQAVALHQEVSHKPNCTPRASFRSPIQSTPY
jgi:hypothetical protein